MAETLRGGETRHGPARPRPTDRYYYLEEFAQVFYFTAIVAVKTHTPYADAIYLRERDAQRAERAADRTLDRADDLGGWLYRVDAGRTNSTVVHADAVDERCIALRHHRSARRQEQPRASVSLRSITTPLNGDDERNHPQRWTARRGRATSEMMQFTSERGTRASFETSSSGAFDGGLGLGKGRQSLFLV